MPRKYRSCVPSIAIVCPTARCLLAPLVCVPIFFCLILYILWGVCSLCLCSVSAAGSFFAAVFHGGFGSTGIFLTSKSRLRCVLSEAADPIPQLCWKLWDGCMEKNYTRYMICRRKEARDSWDCPSSRFFHGPMQICTEGPDGRRWYLTPSQAFALPNLSLFFTGILMCL